MRRDASVARARLDRRSPSARCSRRRTRRRRTSATASRTTRGSATAPARSTERLDRLARARRRPRPRERSTGARSSRARARSTGRGYDALIDGPARARHRAGAHARRARPRWANGGRGHELGADDGVDVRGVRAPRRAALPVRPPLADLERAEPAALAAADARRRSTSQRCSTRPTRRSTRVHPGALVGGGVTAPRAATGGVSPVDWISGHGAAHAQARRLRAQPVSAAPPRRRSRAAATTARRSRWPRSTGCSPTWRTRSAPGSGSG